MRTTFNYAAVLSALAMPSPVLAQAQGAEPGPGAGQALTDEERQMLRTVYDYVKTECTHNASAPYCSSLASEKPVAAAAMVAAPVNPQAAQPTPIKSTVDQISSDGSRQLHSDSGLTIPQKNTADVNFATASDTKTASASLSLDLSPVTHRLTTLGLTVQTPFGQGSDYQNLSTLDGLTKATTAGLQFTFIPAANYTSRSLAYNSDEYQFSCEDVLVQAERIDPKLADDIRIKSTGKYCNDAFLKQAITDSKTITASVKKILIDKIDKIHESTIPVLNSMWMISVNGKFGYEQHAYYADTTLTKSTVNRYPWQVGAAATYVFDNGLMSFTLGYNFQRSYQDGRLKGQQEILCPAANGSVIKCVNGYIDLPQMQVKHLISADWRFIAPRGAFFIPIGIDPGATYDAKSHAYGFQIPIYLATNSSKGLTGGFRYDYTSDKNVSTFGVFVSAAFCVLPGFSGCTPSSPSTSK